MRYQDTTGLPHSLRIFSAQSIADLASKILH
jgi:hypothetical protein